MDVTHLTLPAIFAIVGAVLLISGMAQLPTPWGMFGPTSGRMRFLAALVGLALIVAAFYVYIHQPCPPCSSIVQNPTPPGPDKQSSPPPPAPSPVDTESLIKIIKDKQHEKIGDSTGTLDYQCFTDAKLAAFDKGNVPAQVVADLKKNATFIQLALAIRAMEPAARQDLLQRAANTFRPPWSQLGIDPATSSMEKKLTGQTNAGSTAEREIAEAIANLVRDLCRRPENELKNLLNQS